MKKTEQRNPNTLNIDKVSTLDAVKMMNNEDKLVACAVEKCMPEIAQAIDLIVDSFNKGGRLLYIGAGTSGRLGVLDASECPPTFGTPSSQVIGIIAGGDKCLRSAAENAEDDGNHGVMDCKNYDLNTKDTLVGISVSGDASYVLEALKYAKSVGAHTISLTCNFDALINEVVDIKIVTDVGPEVITGSTRLKSGTAHKMVLNMLSTISMVKTGKVISNLMVNVRPTNIKLFNRCVRIIQTLVDINEETAREELNKGLSIREIVDKYGK